MTEIRQCKRKLRCIGIPKGEPLAFPEGVPMRKISFTLTAASVFLSVLLLAAVSCSGPGEVSRTRLEISIESNDSARTIMPSEALMEVRKYSVSGTGPSGASFGPLFSSESELSVQDLAVGSWTITAKALNAENNELASGSAVLNLTRGENKATVVLDEITGNGTLQLDYSWNEDISGDEFIRIQTSLEDQAGNKTTRTKEVLLSDGMTTLVLNLDAGSYILNVQVLDSSGSIGVGATDAVRIVSNTRSRGEVALRTANPVSSHAGTEITLRNEVGSPMSFYIDYYPKNPGKGKTMTLVATTSFLPDGVKPSDLVFSWYKDGVHQSTGTSYTFSMVSESGVHRYDVIVRSNMEGTMCGASLVLNIPD